MRRETWMVALVVVAMIGVGAGAWVQWWGGSTAVGLGGSLVGLAAMVAVLLIAPKRSLPLSNRGWSSSLVAS